jgi:hypothetical protein
MRLIQLINIQRKETPIYYRKEYSAEAILEFLDKNLGVAIEFIVEHRPIGGVDVRVSLLDELDYPLLPVVNTIKSHIMDLQELGKLP